MLASNLPSSSHPGDYQQSHTNFLGLYAWTCLLILGDKKKLFRLVYTAKWWHTSSCTDALRWAPSLHPEGSRKQNKKKLRTVLSHWYLTFAPSPSHIDREPHLNHKMQFSHLLFYQSWSLYIYLDMCVCSSWHYNGKREINCPSHISAEYYHCHTHCSSCLLTAVPFHIFYLMKICHCQRFFFFPSHLPTSDKVVERVKTNRKLSFWYVWVSLIAYLNGEGIKVVQHHMVGLWQQCRVTLVTKPHHVMTILCLCVGFCSLEVYCKVTIIH